MSDDNEIFKGYAIMIELYNALKFLTMLFFIQKILTFNLDVAFLKSVSICSENKGADQLRSYREADLRLCFRICKTLVFS